MVGEGFHMAFFQHFPAFQLTPFPFGKKREDVKTTALETKALLSYDNSGLGLFLSHKCWIRHFWSSTVCKMPTQKHKADTNSVFMALVSWTEITSCVHTRSRPSLNCWGVRGPGINYCQIMPKAILVHGSSRDAAAGPIPMLL